jgi:glycosyltransferase involved in cell wall biosynthesis
VRQCLLSCRDQTHRPIEIIVVNDGSVDESEKIVHEVFEELKTSSDISVHYFYQENKGAPAARNLGLTNASGSFIKFLDSDDLLPTEGISDLVNAFEDGIDVVFGNGIRIDADSKHILPFGYEGFNNNEPISTVVGRSITMGCLMFRKKCFEAIRFDESIQVMQDRQICVKLLVHGFSFMHFPVVSYLYRFQPASLDTISGKSWVKKNPYRYFHTFETILSYVKNCNEDIVRKSKFGISKSFWNIGRRLLAAGKSTEASLYFQRAMEINGGKMPKPWVYRTFATLISINAFERLRLMLKPDRTYSKR